MTEEETGVTKDEGRMTESNLLAFPLLLFADPGGS
jgi:hypothetical protein